MRNIHNLKNNGSASITELKEFLGTLKGKDPQEVIGIVSSSMLIQSLVMAVVATVIFLAIFTVGPYFVYGPPKSKDLATKQAAPDKENKESAAKTDAASPAATTDAAKSNSPDASKAAKALGIDEVKEADPNKNPLDKGPNIDNLLDGVDKN